MSTESKPPSKPESRRKCIVCGFSYSKKEAVKIIVYDKVEYACPNCGNTRGSRTF
jgi:predicted RNA-binding Zn-ribbon protein involved in translation (DUF1610 family)